MNTMQNYGVRYFAQGVEQSYFVAAASPEAAIQYVGERPLAEDEEIGDFTIIGAELMFRGPAAENDFDFSMEGNAMTTQRKERFVAKTFVESEIDMMMEGYGNSEAEAVEFVRELLNGNEYDHLTDAQRDRAIAYLSRRKGGAK